MSDLSPRDLAAQLPPFGVSGAAGYPTTGKPSHVKHVVDRRRGRTLCGREPLTLFAVDLEAREQVSCRRCIKLAFTSVNACAPHVPERRPA